MICPMSRDEDDTCLEEKCAWWFGAHGCCAIVALANLFSFEVINIRERRE